MARLRHRCKCANCAVLMDEEFWAIIAAMQEDEEYVEMMRWLTQEAAKQSAWEIENQRQLEDDCA